MEGNRNSNKKTMTPNRMQYIPRINWGKPINTLTNRSGYNVCAFLDMVMTLPPVRIVTTPPMIMKHPTIMFTTRKIILWSNCMVEESMQKKGKLEQQAIRLKAIHCQTCSDTIPCKMSVVEIKWWQRAKERSKREINFSKIFQLGKTCRSWK
jgi:hypothetical protein